MPAVVMGLLFIDSQRKVTAAPACCPRRTLQWLAGLLVTAGCSRLDSIPYTPPQTAETWLTIQPFARLQIGSWDVILVQPSTSLIVYLLGILAIAAGVYFFRIRNGHWSRLWWGVALLLWGAGALLAGTSYEAFSHAIKCEGRTACVWTSWWEVIYLILTVASVNAILLAEAFSRTVGRWRRALSIYALVNTASYVVVALAGAFVPSKVLISFELMLVFGTPTILICFFLNGRRYYARKETVDLALLGAWTWLTLTLGAYYLYLALGITQRLWAKGIWFSENDVLHVGLILWMIYIVRVVAKRVEDARVLGGEPAAGNAG